MQEKTEITLVKASLEDAVRIHEMKYRAFQPLYERYQDHDTNPAVESLEKTQEILRQEYTDYLLICCKGELAGAVRVGKRPQRYGIAPIFIVPRFQDQGIGQQVIRQVFERYPETLCWFLDTIKEESRNCHVYEKMGFVRTGAERIVNERMTLVHYEKDLVVTERFQPEDAQEIADLLCRNFREVNAKDYGREAAETLCKSHDREWVLKLCSDANMYVFRAGKVIGCGAISSFWGSLTESILLTVFVLPEYHGRGLGKRIMETPEQDEYYVRAERIEIPASITARDFYRKFGYDYKDGIERLEEEGHYRMEKYKASGR